MASDGVFFDIMSTIKLELVCWNVRGLNNPAKKKALREFADSVHPAIFCIQETKREAFDLAFIKTFYPKRFDKFVFAPSLGASGGIITIWNSSVFVGTPWYVDSFVVGVSFVATQSSDCWKLVNVYGPCTGEDRAAFTTWLYDVHIPNGQDWLLLGDFNYMRAPDNRNKPDGNLNDMITFNDIIRK